MTLGQPSQRVPVIYFAYYLPRIIRSMCFFLVFADTSTVRRECSLIAPLGCDLIRRLRCCRYCLQEDDELTTKEARQAFAGAQNDLCGGDPQAPPAPGAGPQIEQVGRNTVDGACSGYGSLISFSVSLSVMRGMRTTSAMLTARSLFSCW